MLAADAGFRGGSQPPTLASVAGVALDGTSLFYALVPGFGGGSAAVAARLDGGGPDVGRVVHVGRLGARGRRARDGGGVRPFVAVGDPAAPLYVGSDGGASAGPDAGGALNGHAAHFLAFPTR